MSHTMKNQRQLLTRVKKIKGQAAALEAALEQEKDCLGILQQIAAIRGAVNGLMAEVVEGHIREHLAAEHLVQCGCKNIVCLKEPSGYSSGNERYRGYFAVCEKYGLKEQSVDCTYVYEEGIRAAGKMLERYPDVDGVIAGNDMIAMAVYKELIRRGKKIPQEIQLIGFDDVKFGQIFTPELTTIHQSIREMGTAAAQIIEKCVEGQPCQKKNIFDVSLVVRETTMEW